MTTTMEPRTTAEIGGIGHSVRRKEDDRFVQGAGRYVDDIVLPGMLHMAILRSPFAHARIVSIDASEAQALDGVIAVVTGELMAAHNLAWMPTLSGDTQAVLATDKVRYQGQEVAAVIATDPYIARDALSLINVDYDELPVIINPQRGLEPDAPLIRDEKEGQTDNVAYTWETGDKAGTDAAFSAADRVVTLDTFYPRSHPAPLETCGVIADINPATGQATIYLTSQAPHAHRTLFALVAGLPEQNIRIISPDIGGGFGNKVPIYPGYVVATAASLLLGKPVKWVESRSENIISTGFARDYYMRGELALDADGHILAMRASILSDQGAFYADAQPSKFRAGLFHICTGSYDIPVAHVSAKGVFTNKAPGGVAYRCSFRVTEASYLVERLVQNAAYELGMDPVEFRRRNFIRSDQFPYKSATGFVYDSGDYHGALDLALEMADYEGWQRKKAEPHPEGKLIGVGIASFTEVVGAGHSKEYDIAGLKMFDSAELRIHPTGKAILKLGVKSQGQGHETTFAQIVAEELGIPAGDIVVQEGDTDNTPYGLGHLRLPLHPGRRSRHRGDLPQDQREGQGDRRPPPRGRRGGPRLGAGAVLRQGLARPGCHHPGRGVRRLHQPPRRDGGRVGGGPLLRPAQHDLPVRLLRRRGRGRPRGRHLEGPQDGGGRRLRGADKPDDRRGSDPRRVGRGVRQGVQPVDHLRRGGKLHRDQLPRLSGADRVGDPSVRVGGDGDPVAAPPDRGKGGRRVGHRGVTRRLCQRGDRRLVVFGGEEHRHARPAAPGVGCPQRDRGEPLIGGWRKADGGP